MRHLETIEDIEQAIADGYTVYAGTDNYVVIRDCVPQYLIKCLSNDYYIGLQHTDQCTCGNCQASDNGPALNADRFYTYDKPTGEKAQHWICKVEMQTDPDSYKTVLVDQVYFDGTCDNALEHFKRFSKIRKYIGQAGYLITMQANSVIIQDEREIAR